MLRLTGAVLILIFISLIALYFYGASAPAPTQLIEEPVSVDPGA